MTAGRPDGDGSQLMERIDRLMNGGAPDPTALVAALAEFDRITVPPVLRSRLAAGLVIAQVRTGPRTDMSFIRRLTDLIRIADEHPPPFPQWPSVRAGVTALDLVRAVGEYEVSPADALSTLDTMGSTTPLTDVARQGVLLLASLRAGDRDTFQRSADTAATFADRQPGIDIEGEFLRRAAAFHRAFQDDRHDDADALFASLTELTGTLPADHMMRSSVEELGTMLDLTRAQQAGGDTSAPMFAVEELTRRAGGSDRDGARFHAFLGVSHFAGGTETDPEKIDEGIVQLRAALDRLPSDDPEAAFHHCSLGLGLYRRFELLRDREALAEAARNLSTAVDLAGGPEHPVWTLASQVRATALRELGRVGESRSAALASLRGYAWSALLQSTVDGAASAALGAADSALGIAREFLFLDNAADDAVRALDAGRGLILFASTEIRALGERLEAAGNAELATRWQAAGGDPERVPAGLRREVLAALAGASARFLDPPDRSEIQAALGALGCDALVYLVPGQDGLTGAALVVPATGGTASMALIGLSLGDDGELDEYLAAASRRDNAAAEPTAEPVRDLGASDALRQSLDPLCDWAWRSAVGPLLEQYVPKHLDVPAGRVPRLVLIPVGNLARVPWHAARRDTDGRFAVEFAAFSYAASARMLCDSAARDPVEPGVGGLIVGDPRTDGAGQPLTAARAEAFAIREAFYIGARYAGRCPDGSDGPAGAGTAEQVVDWLTSRRPGAGAMLHLACHGVVVPEGASRSYLCLAGGTLTAEEIVGRMAAHPERRIGLVVLAACRSWVTARGYDEAYSLSTTFLAGGARTVLSTQWSVPDDATSVLMFMFHHYLRVERHPARDALRLAQMWMVDPRRRVPSTMPPQLRRQLDGTDPAEIVSWAGFVHAGR